MSKAYQPLHHKYRPQRFDQLVGQEAIATTLANALRSGRIAPAYLFCGPRGTGKTSSARILARSLNCIGSEGPTPEPCGVCELCTSIAAGNALDVIEIDAASNTGVDNIRELIERSRFAPVQARWKVYVVDECHMLSTAAFNALLKTLEEPPPRVVFVLATTDPQRVLPTILSRCQRFDFRRIPLQALERHLAWIAEQESIDITDEALLVVAQRAQGGLRDAESLLDQLSLLPAPIAATAVWDLLGAVPEQELLELARALGAAEPVAVLETSRELLERGREPASVLQGLVSLLRDLVLAGVAPERLELTGVSPQLRGQLPDLARSIGKARLLTWQAQLRGSEQQLRHSVNPRLWLEVLLLGLLAEAGSTGSATVPPAARQPSAQTPTAVPSAEHAPVPAVAAQSDAAQPVAGQSAAVADPDGGGAEEAPDLGELWQRILAGLELPSTRMLLSQQARLVRLDERQAVVQVAGTWMAMVQTRQALVEQAIARTLGSTRQLVLQAGLDTPSPTAGGSPPAVPAAAPPAHTAPPAPRAAGSATQSQPIAQPQPATQPSPAPPGAPTPLVAPPTGAAGTTTALDQQARRLAEFFNGEVIDFDGPIDDALPAAGDGQDGASRTTSRAA
ncbi:MAG: DNA polymerase III subunit gamma/tau [Prochlorococcaceae cyanobacterium]